MPSGWQTNREEYELPMTDLEKHNLFSKNLKTVITLLVLFINKWLYANNNR